MIFCLLLFLLFLLLFLLRFFLPLLFFILFVCLCSFFCRLDFPVMRRFGGRCRRRQSQQGCMMFMMAHDKMNTVVMMAVLCPPHNPPSAPGNFCWSSQQVQDAIIRGVLFVPLFTKFLTQMHRDALTANPVARLLPETLQKCWRLLFGLYESTRLQSRSSLAPSPWPHWAPLPSPCSFCSSTECAQRQLS